MALGTNYRRQDRKEDLIIQLGMHRLKNQSLEEYQEEATEIRRMSVASATEYVKAEIKRLQL